MLVIASDSCGLSMFALFYLFANNSRRISISRKFLRDRVVVKIILHVNPVYIEMVFYSIAARGALRISSRHAILRE